eukprot:38327-Amphidinium_carterae.1
MQCEYVIDAELESRRSSRLGHPLHHHCSRSVHGLGGGSLYSKGTNGAAEGGGDNGAKAENGNAAAYGYAAAAGYAQQA